MGARDYLRERGLLNFESQWFEHDSGGRGPFTRLNTGAVPVLTVTTHDLPPTPGYPLAGERATAARARVAHPPEAAELADSRAEQAGWMASCAGSSYSPARELPAMPTREAVILFFTGIWGVLRLDCWALALADAVGEASHAESSPELPTNIELAGAVGRPRRDAAFYPGGTSSPEPAGGRAAEALRAAAVPSGDWRTPCAASVTRLPRRQIRRRVSAVPPSDLVDHFAQSEVPPAPGPSIGRPNMAR